MNWCTRCVLPDTRPGIELDAAGVCSACRAHGTRDEAVDWAARAAAFGELVERTRALDRRWDCVIPVSGGKDSTWQVVTCLEHGLHPLAVTWRTPGRTPLGQCNLDNLISLGVDHVDFTCNPQVERRFLLASLDRFGTTAIPMHLALFNIPLTIAARYDVPLVVWGENSAAEYVGDTAATHRLDAEWVRRYGAVHGTTAADWVSDELSERDLAPYFGPTDAELEAKGVEAVFLGEYLRWDPEMTARVAAEHGFKSRDEGPKTGVYAHADIDDDFISIHHYLKWPKFGFTRSFDNLSLEIRNGRLTRDQAIARLRELGDETPHDDIAKFAAYARITTDDFFARAERWRAPDVWTRRADGVWTIEDFLIDDWRWA